MGSAVASSLLDAGETVTVVARDPAHVAALRDRGAQVAVVDVGDAAALRDVLRTGHRAFVLNPPADPSGDTDVEERRTAGAIAAAVDGSGLEKVVAASTYGARPGERIGDLSVLHEFEQRLLAIGVPVAVNRGAYYLSNWDSMLASARDEGVIHSMFPADMRIPMVAPADLGVAAARRLRSPVDDVGVRYVEGPDRCSAQDVADAFGRALGRPVAVAVVGPDDWLSAFESMGFSPAAADSYARMTKVSVSGSFEEPDDPDRGTTTLDDHIGGLVAKG